MSETNPYAELAAVNVSEKVEKKGKFAYLSWAWAVDQLRRKDPKATWEVKRFDGMPFLKTELGYFVEVEVTSHDIPMSQIHPVLDNYNKPIAKPTPFDINSSIQRALVKAIALHGLGLYIYAGEDLPFEEPPIPAAIEAQTLGRIKVLAGQFANVRDKSNEDVYKALGITDLESLSEEQGQAYIKQLEAWLSKAKQETPK